jgi:hypothetical protein
LQVAIVGRAPVRTERGRKGRRTSDAGKAVVIADECKRVLSCRRVVRENVKQIAAADVDRFFSLRGSVRLQLGAGISRARALQQSQISQLWQLQLPEPSLLAFKSIVAYRSPVLSP